MKIVISGGLGYVGGRLSKYFAEAGHEVIALSRQAGTLQNVLWPNGLTILHPDVFLKEAHLWKSADVFIHLAALNENDCIQYPYEAIDVNISQTLRWLDLAYSRGIKKFVYFSTAHVYGKPLTGYYDEATLTRPVHPYAITHKCAEDYVLAYNAEKGMSNLVIRLSNSFGGPAFPTADRWTLLVNDLCRSAVTSGKMTLLSNGLQMRDFICLQDVCAAVFHLLRIATDKNEDCIFNMSAGISVTVWDMALMIKKEAEGFLNRSVELTRAQAGYSDKIDTLEISNKKLLSTGFRLRTDMRAEIKSTLEFFKANNF
jgi:UDP-glucose 4-epimerase